MILGGGGHGKDLAEIVRADGTYDFGGFLDDDPTVPGVVGTVDALDPQERFLIGINDPTTRWTVHTLMLGRAVAPTIMHPTAVIAEDFRGGAGAVIAALTQIGPEVALGAHTHVGPGVTITRARVGSCVTVSPGATICGDVTIGSRTLIGAGAIVKNLVNIGTDCTIGAGAVVVRDVPDGTVVVGNPARAR